MDFAITCVDKPGSLELRTATREAHLDYLLAAGAALKLAGPMLDEQGRPIGSLLVVEAADEATVRARLSEDPWPEEMLTVESVRPWSVWLRASPFR